ncbi:MAG: methyltransferase domain-containing protein [bacterium]|nr:methyltransferase domain-containing protein [bacterium]
MFSRAEYRSATALLKNAIQEKANCNILHVACGVKSLELAGVNAAAMILLDRSHAMLRHAALRNPQATLLCADTSALPFQNETFDGIVAIGISEYIGEPLAWLLELKRCLRPGGALILSIAPDHWRNRIRKLWNRELWLREQKEWFEYFRQSGFQVVETSELLLQVQFRCT